MDRILRFPDVARLTGMSRDHLRRLGKTEAFPKPVKISVRAIGWRESEVRNWLESRKPASKVAS